MQTLAETLPEYAVLRSMAGVGDRLGPLILAEIGDIRRFHSGKALNAYAGNDAPPYQSGTFESHNRHISKRGNAALRKYCFEVMPKLLRLTVPCSPLSYASMSTPLKMTCSLSSLQIFFSKADCFSASEMQMIFSQNGAAIFSMAVYIALFCQSTAY